MEPAANRITCNCASHSPISRICQGQAYDDSMFASNHIKTPLLHYVLHHAVLEAESSKSELAIKKETEFKHKSNKN